MTDWGRSRKTLPALGGRRGTSKRNVSISNLAHRSAAPWLISYRGKVWLPGTSSTRSGGKSPDLVPEVHQDSDPASAGRFRDHSFYRAFQVNRSPETRFGTGRREPGKKFVFGGRS